MKDSIKIRIVAVLSLLLSICLLLGIIPFVSYADYTTPMATLVPGASVRVVSEDSSGIKFTARLNKQEYTQLYDQLDGDLKAGMIIVPTDYIKTADGYTFSAFNDANLTVGFKTVEQFKEVSVGGVNYFEFTASLTNLKAFNYVRDFEGIVYVESSTYFAGSEQFNDKYYAYSERVESSARNIYEVAYTTFNDRTESQDEDHAELLADGTYAPIDNTGMSIAKGFIDGVAQLTYDKTLGKVVVANDTDYYTSPYNEKIYKESDNHYVVFGANTVIYNGNQVNDKVNDDENGLYLYNEKANGATVNADGTITLNNVNYFNKTKDDYHGTPNSYVSFNGEYGIGTEVSFTFTGGNVPYVMLFADEINGDMTDAGGKGIIIMPGNVQQTSNGHQDFRIYGPNRMNVINTDMTGVEPEDWGANGGVYFTNYYLLSRFNGMPTTEFKYVVNTSLNLDNTINIILKLYEGAGAQEPSNVSTYSTNLKWGDDVTAGSIIAYAGVNGVHESEGFIPSDTTFKVSINNSQQGVIYNQDGSITLEGTALWGTAQTAFMDQLKFNCIGGDNLGVGKCYTFEFTGNNMPIVTLFADNLNGMICSNGGAGVTLINGSYLNGVAEQATAADGMDYLRIWATNQRINAQPYMWLDSASGLLAMKNFPSQSEFDANKDYIYIIGTSESQSGKLVVYVYLYEKQATQNLYIFGESIETNLAVSELSGTKTMITPALKDVMVGGVRTAQDTTIKSIVVSDGLVEPENVLYASGATFNNDGSVTLDGVFYQNRRQDCYTETPNSYVAKEGEYGVGTEISITYAPGRANMPNLVLFADKINGNMTSDGGKGIFITPGVKTPQSGLVGEFRIYGPDRMNQPNTLHYGGFEENASGSTINYFLLGQCVDNVQGTETTYTWKIKTSLDTDDNTLVLTMYLYKDSTGGLLAETEIDTGLVWGTDISAGSMIAYAAIYNEGTAEDGSDAVLHDSTFTWTVTKPE